MAIEKERAIKLPFIVIKQGSQIAYQNHQDNFIVSIRLYRPSHD